MSLVWLGVLSVAQTTQSACDVAMEELPRKTKHASACKISETTPASPVNSKAVFLKDVPYVRKPQELELLRLCSRSGTQEAVRLNHARPNRCQPLSLGNIYNIAPEPDLQPRGNTQSVGLSTERVEKGPWDPAPR